jgi:ribosomal protein S14
VNPDHLFLGTNAENTADRDRKGRACKGDRHPLRLNPYLVRHVHLRTAKLTEGDVREIRSIWDGRGPGRPIALLSELAQRFGVSRSSIRELAHRRTWKSVA